MSTLEETLENLASSSHSIASAVTLIQERLAVTENLQAAQEKFQRRQTTIIRGLVLSLILDITLSVVAILGITHQAQQSNELQSVQTRTSSGVLCPLYELILTTLPAHPTNVQLDANHDGTVSAVERSAYTAATAVIYHGYNLLACGAPPAHK